jgi:hypothetical protein
MRTRLATTGSLLALAAAGVFGGCGSGDDDTQTEGADLSSTAGVPTFLDQWSESARDGYYRTSEGSQLLPYEWFLALEAKGGTTLFRADDNIVRLGYLPASAGSTNPDALPVGFARDDDPKTGAWLGMTCAACHTSQITFRGRALRIDGGPGLGNLTDFLSGVSESLHATLADADKLARFAKRVGGDDAASLRSELEKETKALDARLARNRAPRSPGYGHIDPVANIFNEVICGPTGMSENCETPSAPMKLPHIWGTADLDWVQANALAANPLPRNISQAMGVFARTTVEQGCSADGASPPSGPFGGACEFESTVRIQNMARLTGRLHELQPPRWPSDLLGAPDRTLAARGAEIYSEKCNDCHARPPYPMTEPNPFGKQFVKVTMVPLQEIGTDPLMAERTVMRRADPGPFRGYFSAQDIGSDGKVPALALVGLAIGGALQNALKSELGITDVTNAPPELFDFRLNPTPTPEQLLSYKARPLAGIAFAGYLLHNGSIPSVYELLLPPDKRSTVFFVGSREYDPKHLGFVSDHGAPGTTAFDTKVPGQSNAGHTYGTDLGEPDRLALIEYLKTL